MTTALLLIALLQQARDVAPRPQPTAILTGVVVTDEAQPKPVRRVRVTISGGDSALQQKALTDDAGRFEFAGLAAGTYTVTASKPGWVPMQYGATRTGRPGTAVPLKSGERASIAIRLPRGAVITGTVAEQDGRPAPNVTVRAMRWAFERGERRLVTAGTSIVSDDRGVYRIYALPAGDYIVGAWYGTGGRAGIGELQLTTDLDVQYASADPRASMPEPTPRTVDFAPTYFPGTSSQLQATVVSVRPGEERSGVDMVLQLIRTARIEGTVTMPGSSELNGPVAVTLIATAAGASFPGVPTASSRTFGVQADGSFSFANVAPGPYTLVARLPGPEPLSASTSVDVAGDDVSGIALMLGPGMTISGRVRFDAVAGSHLPDPRDVRILLQPVPGQPAITVSPAAAAVNEDGSFSLKGVTPGEYRLGASVTGVNAGPWQLKAATIGGRDAADVPAILASGSSAVEAQITFTDRLAELTGSLQNAEGRAAPEYTIVLYANEPSFWTPQSRRIQAVRPSADGSYSFRNLLSGNYLLAAVDDAEPGAWYDPAWLAALVPASMKIAIGDAQIVVQDLRLGR